MNSKTRLNRNAGKDVNDVIKSKFFKEINKISRGQVKAQTACPIQRVAMRKSMPEFQKEQKGAVYKNVPRVKAYRTQSSQTDLEVNEYEGIIRYPSTRSVAVREKKEIGLQVERTSPRVQEVRRRSPTKDHVKVNQVIPTIKPKLLPAKKADPLRAPLTYQRGIIPKYLQKLKEEEEKHASHVRQVTLDKFRLKDADLIEKEEKLKRISSWHESYKKMVSDLNMLSVAS